MAKGKPEQRRMRPKLLQAFRPQSTSEEIDQELAEKARQKLHEGKQPTALEINALKRVEKHHEEELRWAYYETIPKGHWAKMSGVQVKQIHDHARKYGFPLLDRKINLPVFVQFFHGFLTKNWRKLAGLTAQNGTGESDEDKSLLKLRQERVKAVELDNLEREKVLIRREHVHQALGRFVAILRNACETLQKQCGQDAFEILEEAIQDMEQEMAAFEGKDAVNSE